MVPDTTALPPHDVPPDCVAPVAGNDHWRPEKMADDSSADRVQVTSVPRSTPPSGSHSSLTVSVSLSVPPPPPGSSGSSGTQ